MEEKLLFFPTTFISGRMWADSQLFGISFFFGVRLVSKQLLVKRVLLIFWSSLVSRLYFHLGNRQLSKSEQQRQVEDDHLKWGICLKIERESLKQ